MSQPTPLIPVDLSGASALVVDSNTTTRSVIVTQLRDLRVKEIQPAFRISDARKYLEGRTYDIVICDHFFPQESSTGQDLRDDLRRGGLLPFATIFLMVTAEARYSKVAEAAESALDGYLLKPFTTARLAERIAAAKLRKLAMQDIYEAIEAQDFPYAARLCLQHFKQRGDYWMYAARVGAELLLRLTHFDQAQRLYEAVVQANPQPWARLGIARVQLEMGLPHQALPVLQTLTQDEPGYADGFDILGRTLMELGRFDEALTAYRTATQLTPASISRLQRHGMLAFYRGEKDTTTQLLERSVRLGLGSKMFDGQSLTLLGMLRFEASDKRQFATCQLDLRRMALRNPESVRLRRMAEVLTVLDWLLNDDPREAVAALQPLLQAISLPDFDFEAACNLLTVLVLLWEHRITVPNAQETVHALGLRFATSKAMAELLEGAARRHEGYCEILERCNLEVLRLIEAALAPSLTGEPRRTVEDLLAQGSASFNNKVIETAWLVLKRYEAKIPNAAELAAKLQPLRQLLGTAYNKPVLGDRNLRQSGGVSLRGMDTPPVAPTLAAALPAAALAA